MTQEKAYKKLQNRIRWAHVRYCLLSFYFYFVKTAFYLLAIACSVALMLKFLPAQTNDYLVLGALAALAVPVSFIWYMAHRSNVEVTALLADKHLRLKEKISSALEFGHDRAADPNEQAWRLAVLNDALRELGRINLKKAFPIKNPREARWLWIPVFVLFLTVVVLPQWDYVTGKGTAQAKAIEEKKIEKEIQKLIQRQLVLERAAKEKKAKQTANKLAKEVKDLATDLSKGKIEKRDALAKLSSLEKRWEDRKKELAETQPQLSSPLAQKPKMTGELAQALEAGDLEKAAQALNKIQKQMKMGNLDKQGMERLSDELKDMAAAIQAELPVSKALEKASEFMKQGAMGEAMKALALAELDLDDLADLAEQIGLLDGALKDLKKSKLALAGKFGKCESCGLLFGDGEGFCNGSCSGNGNSRGKGGTGPWRPGDSRKQGNGMGGPGIGRGGQAQFADDDAKTHISKLKGQFGSGKTLGVLPVDGSSIKGQSVIQVNEAIVEYRQAAEEALTKERVPLPYRYQVRAYFNALEQDAVASKTSGE